ncbi:MAG: UDP-N-acetylmuramoyl-tripeptide--D-alanyl-D-alanine ligase [Firmicutes bacterium]|nr:UDP-N-acetylmuramoyl-tripeptide--D-alanyl-D-alanine ligase [Bacillota bacterium]
MGFSLAEVAEVTGGHLVGDPGLTCVRVSIDSRRVEPGDLFFALRGERHDGHDFIPQAIAAGARAFVASRPVEVPAGVGAVFVPDTIAALGALARHHRRRFRLPVVAVTGSTGKTTTKEMIAAIGAVRHRVVKNEGNFNNEIGLPLTILALRPQDELLVVEMGMRGRGQIAALAAIAEPEIGGVTNIGLTHLELLGSQEAIAEAKGELVAALPGSGVAILNGDDARCAALAAKTGARVIRFGLGETAEVRATALVEGPEGSEFLLRAPGGAGFPVRLNVPGRHQVQNALAAATAALALGLTPEEIQAGLADFGLARGRGGKVMAPGGWTVIDDTYNANPASMDAALRVMAARSIPGRRVAVLGDMLELGSATEAAHREVGRLAAGAGLSLLLTFGEAAREIGHGAVEAGFPSAAVRHYTEKSVLLETLRSFLRPGDVVLVKGSRGMHMEEIVAGLLHKEG